MATIRERQPAVWVVRVFTGTNGRGKPTQMSRTVRGTKRDAGRRAASLEVGPGSASPAGRRVEDLLDARIDQNIDTWAPASARDQQSRVRSIKRDKIASVSIAQLSIADVERWHTRLRRDGMRDAGIRNLHGSLSAAFGQAVRWGWVNQNVVAPAQRKTSKRPPRGVMSRDDLRGANAAAESFDPAAAVALRIAALTGARRAATSNRQTGASRRRSGTFMIRVTTICAASAGASARYYTGCLAEPDGELPGRWTGRQAAAFGLVSEVPTEALESLLSGRHPITGQALGRGGC